jgi:hypothetical protein
MSAPPAPERQPCEAPLWASLGNGSGRRLARSPPGFLENVHGGSHRVDRDGWAEKAARAFHKIALDVGDSAYWASCGSPDALATHSFGPASRGASAGPSTVDVV